MISPNADNRIVPQPAMPDASMFAMFTDNFAWYFGFWFRLWFSFYFSGHRAERGMPA
ncbi:MAG: hypothetical protein ACKV2V_03995 [Blastocatellia bacterium]